MTKTPEKLEIILTNGSLTQVKELAEYYGIPNTELKTVIVKALQVLVEIKKSGNTYAIIEDLNGDREKVDLKNI